MSRLRGRRTCCPVVLPVRTGMSRKGQAQMPIPSGSPRTYGDVPVDVLKGYLHSRVLPVRTGMSRTPKDSLDPFDPFSPYVRGCPVTAISNHQGRLVLPVRTGMSPTRFLILPGKSFSPYVRGCPGRAGAEVLPVRTGMALKPYVASHRDESSPRTYGDVPDLPEDRSP